MHSCSPILILEDEFSYIFCIVFIVICHGILVPPMIILVEHCCMLSPNQQIISAVVDQKAIWGRLELQERKIIYSMLFAHERQLFPQFYENMENITRKLI